MSDSVYRVTEVIGTSAESWEAAAQNAVETAAQTVRDLRIAEATRFDVTIENGKVSSYRVRLDISFKYDAREVSRRDEAPRRGGAATSSTVVRNPRSAADRSSRRVATASSSSRPGRSSSPEDDAGPGRVEDRGGGERDPEPGRDHPADRGRPRALLDDARAEPVALAERDAAVVEARLDAPRHEDERLAGELRQVDGLAPGRRWRSGSVTTNGSRWTTVNSTSS